MTNDVVGTDGRAREVRLTIDAILAALCADQALIATPERIAPHLGITPHSVRHYCRKLKSLDSWKGQYIFMLDDAQHIEHLHNLLRLALWSMKCAPKRR